MTPKREKWDGDIFDNPDVISAKAHVIHGLEQGPEPLTRCFQRKLHWMRQCGQFPVGVDLKDGQVVRVYRNRCRCRGCLACDTLLAGDTRAMLRPVVEERRQAGAKFSMITLTMPHSRTDLAQKNLSLLFLALRVFQRSASFRRHVRAYARGIEVTWGEEYGFHPHVHYFVEAAKWRKEDLKATWTQSMAAVGGPFIPPNGAHVTGIKKRVDKGLMEAVGYPFKAANLCTMPLSELCQMLYATRRRHMTQLSRDWSRRGKVRLEQQAAETEGLAMADGVTRVDFRELIGLVRTGHNQAFDLAVKVAEHLAANLATVPMAQSLFAMLKTQDECRGGSRHESEGIGTSAADAA